METVAKTMKRTLLLLSFCILALSPRLVLAQGWQWVRTADKSLTAGSATASAHAWPVATDASGNVYMAMWSGFDSVSLGAATLHSTTYQTQVILVKYDKDGNVLWVRSSTSGNTMPIDIAVDPSGNVLLYGYFTGENVAFGSHTITRTAGMGANTCYIIKYNNDGDLLWKINSGTISLGNERQSYGSLATDKLGNVYAMATYYGAVKIGVTTLTNAGGEDIFVTKYSAGGGLVWAKRFGGAGYEKASAITVANDNSVYITGEFSSPSIQFGSSSLYYSASYPSAGYECFNVFLAKLDAEGNALWAKQSTGNSRVMCVVADNQGDVYIGGSFRSDTVAFSGSVLYNNDGNPYYVKYAANGDLIRIMPFVQTLPGEGTGQSIWDMAIDICNNVWVAGGMDSAFGNGVLLDTVIVMPQPQERIDPMFIAAYTEAGILADYSSLGSGGLSNSGLATDANGALYLSGYYNAAKPLYVGVDSLNAVANAYTNYFLAKYTSNSCLPSGISLSGNNAVADITLFPNPASGILYIVAPFTISQVAITDVMGKTVYSAQASKRSASVNVSHLAPGIYFVRLNGGQVRRFVKE